MRFKYLRQAQRVARQNQAWRGAPLRYRRWLHPSVAGMKSHRVVISP